MYKERKQAYQFEQLFAVGELQLAGSACFFSFYSETSACPDSAVIYLASLPPEVLLINLTLFLILQSLLYQLLSPGVRFLIGIPDMLSSKMGVDLRG